MIGKMMPKDFQIKLREAEVKREKSNRRREMTIHLEVETGGKRGIMRRRE